MEPAPYFNLASSQNSHDLEDQVKNAFLLNKIIDFDLPRKSERDTVEIIKEKVAKVEAAALKSFEKRVLEIATLKK